MRIFGLTPMRKRFRWKEDSEHNEERERERERGGPGINFAEKKPQE